MCVCDVVHCAADVGGCLHVGLRLLRVQLPHLRYLLGHSICEHNSNVVVGGAKGSG